MSVQKEAVHSIHVTLDITQLYQEWLHVTCVLQVGCVVIILIIDAIITIRYKLEQHFPYHDYHHGISNDKNTKRRYLCLWPNQCSRRLVSVCFAFMQCLNPVINSEHKRRETFFRKK